MEQCLYLSMEHLCVYLALPSTYVLSKLDYHPGAKSTLRQIVSTDSTWSSYSSSIRSRLVSSCLFSFLLVSSRFVSSCLFAFHLVLSHLVLLPSLLLLRWQKNPFDSSRSPDNCSWTLDLSPSDTFASPTDDFDFEPDNDPLVAFKGAVPIQKVW